MLNEFATSAKFVPTCLHIMVSNSVPASTKKAAAILLDKKIMSISNIKELSVDELKMIGALLIEGLCHETVPSDLKIYLRSSLHSITYGQIESKAALI